MRRTAGSPAVAGAWTAARPGQSTPQKAVAPDLSDAWRLAFVIVVDGDLATRAVTKAFVSASPTPPASSAPPASGNDIVSAPPRLDLLSATLRISLTRAGTMDRDCDSAVTTALWQLPAEQRAALWLAKVDELDDSQLGRVLDLSAANAGHIADRAAEWLDVALDHESGPLCPEESRLDDFVHDRLAADEAAEMRRHVPDCPTCRSKSRAFEELADLKSVLLAAVPEPPAWLTIETLQRRERVEPTDDDATLVDSRQRIPAVRPLAACCAALLLVGLIGIAVVHPHKSRTDPGGANDPNAILPGLSATPAGGDVVGSSAALPLSTATTVTVTTTSLPAVTFPTIPAGVGRKTKH